MAAPEGYDDSQQWILLEFPEGIQPGQTFELWVPQAPAPAAPQFYNPQAVSPQYYHAQPAVVYQQAAQPSIYYDPRFTNSFGFSSVYH